MMESKIWVEEWREYGWSIEGFAKRSNTDPEELAQYVKPHPGYHSRVGRTIYYRE